MIREYTGHIVQESDVFTRRGLLPTPPVYAEPLTTIEREERRALSSNIPDSAMGVVRLA